MKTNLLLLVVLGHLQHLEVEDHQSVNTQLPIAEDRVGLL